MIPSEAAGLDTPPGTTPREQCEARCHRRFLQDAAWHFLTISGEVFANWLAPGGVGLMVLDELNDNLEACLDDCTAHF